MKKFGLLLLIPFIVSCMGTKDNTQEQEYSVKIMTLDPGHFHAALVQKSMYEQVSPKVHIYAPEGEDVHLHLGRIEGFNTRQEGPTSWETEIYTGEDFLQKMLEEKPGNLVVISGNNRDKTQYIKKSVDAGLNVLADKPMAIDVQGFELLKEAFNVAEANNVLLYDIMTERYEITTMLQKEFSQLPAIFGTLKPGTPEDPSVTKESVHHFFKYVSGNPLKRPAWFFDVNQQGEGIVDVTTHLVDLVQWECYPEEIINYQTDIEIASAKRWPTKISLSEFNKVTGQAEFPELLNPVVENDTIINVYANGEIVYKLKDTYAKVLVIWNYQAPEGAGDTHYSIMKGTEANLVIRQGEEQNYKPELYIEPAAGQSVDDLLNIVNENSKELVAKYPGITFKAVENGIQVEIPQNYRAGHEAHFAQVMEKYLEYLKQGQLPVWEVPNMISKYYTTTKALEIANPVPSM